MEGGGQSKRLRSGGHGGLTQCVTPTPPLLRFRKKEKGRPSEKVTGLLGDLTQCKHGTICCSEIWSRFANSDREGNQPRRIIGNETTGGRRRRGGEG